jgi:hypothetical protein
MSKLWQRIEFDVHGDVQSTDPAQTDHSVVVDPCCMILSNLTIDPENCERVWTGFVQVRCGSRNRFCPILDRCNDHYFRRF